MNDVEIKVTVPPYMAKYLVEMCEQEADYWHQQVPPRDDVADEWEELGGEIWSAIEEADQCQSK